MHCVFRTHIHDKTDDGVWLQSRGNDFKSSSVLYTVIENRVLGHVTPLWVQYSKTQTGSDLCSFISWRHQRLMTTEVERNEYTPLKLDSGILNGPPGCGDPGCDPPGGGAPGGDPPGHGALGRGCGAPGHGGRSGGKGATPPSGRTYHGLVAPKFGARGVQHSSGHTSQAETQQKSIYLHGTSQQRYQRMCELKSQRTGAKTFPPPPAHLRDNIQPMDIPRTHGLPIRSNLSHLDVMLKVHGIRSLELTPLPLPEQVKRTPMKSHMASVPQTSSMKRSRDDSDSSEDSSIDVDMPNLLLHNPQANVKVLEAYEAYQREQKIWKRAHSEAMRKLSSVVQSQPNPDQPSASGAQPLASGSGEYWARPSGEFLTDQLVQISMERARRYAEAQLSRDDDDNGSLPPSVSYSSIYYSSPNSNSSSFSSKNNATA